MRSKAELDIAIDILKRTPRIPQAYLNNFNSDLALSNEGENTWSAFDIIYHLIHGEKTDWLSKIKIILSTEKGEVLKSFPPFDRFA